MNQVMLEVTKTVRADDQDEADAYFGRLRVEVNSESNYLEIRTHYPDNEWGGIFHWLFHGGSRNANVNYVLKVPSTIKLDAGSTNGYVEVDSITGGVKARSTNGNVKIQSASGDVIAKSTNGKLDFDDVCGKIDGSTTNGSITAVISDAVEFRGLNLGTTNGSINIYCPDDINADVTAHTTNGSVRTEIPVTVQGDFGGKSFEGRMNKGGAQIRLHTTNGSIEINKR